MIFANSLSFKNSLLLCETNFEVHLHVLSTSVDKTAFRMI